MSYISALNRQYHFVLVPTELTFKDSKRMHPETNPPRIYNYKMTVNKGVQVFS